MKFFFGGETVRLMEEAKNVYCTIFSEQLDEEKVSKVFVVITHFKDGTVLICNRKEPRTIRFRHGQGGLVSSMDEGLFWVGQMHIVRNSGAVGEVADPSKDTE